MFQIPGVTYSLTTYEVLGKMYSNTMMMNLNSRMVSYSNNTDDSVTAVSNEVSTDPRLGLAKPVFSTSHREACAAWSPVRWYACTIGLRFLTFVSKMSIMFLMKLGSWMHELYNKFCLYNFESIQDDPTTSALRLDLNCCNSIVFQVMLSHDFLSNASLIHFNLVSRRHHAEFT